MEVFQQAYPIKPATEFIPEPTWLETLIEYVTRIDLTIILIIIGLVITTYFIWKKYFRGLTIKELIRKDILLKILISIILTSFFHTSFRDTCKFIYRDTRIEMLSDIAELAHDYSLPITFILITIIVFNIQGFFAKKDWYENNINDANNLYNLEYNCFKKIEFNSQIENHIQAISKVYIKGYIIKCK